MVGKIRHLKHDFDHAGGKIIVARIMRAVIVYYVPLQEVSNGFSDRMSDSLRTEWAKPTRSLKNHECGLKNHY